MTERMDYGKPGDPSGCYLPREWRSPGAEIGHKNREAVRQFFADHLGCTNVECAKALGLSVMSVGRHVATIRKGWGPDRCPTEAEKTAQGARCGCRGTDDYCPCQNVVQT